MIRLNRKEDCCGCGACAQVCSKNAIAMQPDEEGFLYPFVKENLCTDCGMCDRVCPVLNNDPETPFEQKGFLAQNRDESVLSKSSSGGVFSALANWTIDKGGAVFGAVMDEKFNTLHTYTETPEGLARMRGSKYVQSEIGNSFREAEMKLKAGQFVLFSGTPCQLEGLMKYLGHDYPTLLTVDVVCHACPSPKIWKAYAEMMQARAGMKITHFSFRDKTRFGYQMTTMSAYCEKQNISSAGIATDPYLRAFFSNICDRPSCYSCAFKKRYRCTDLTIWDCFDPSRLKLNLNEEFKLNKGVSCVLAHSERGKKIIEELSNDLKLCPADPDELANSSREMCHSVKENANRSKFFADAQILSPEDLFERYFPVKWKNKGEDLIRRIGIKTGLYTAIRKTAKKVLPNFKRF